MPPSSQDAVGAAAGQRWAWRRGLGLLPVAETLLAAAAVEIAVAAAEEVDHAKVAVAAAAAEELV